MYSRLRLEGTLRDVYHNVACNFATCNHGQNCSIMFPSLPAQGEASEVSRSECQDGPFKTDGRNVTLI